MISVFVPASYPTGSISEAEHHDCLILLSFSDCVQFKFVVLWIPSVKRGFLFWCSMLFSCLNSSLLPSKKDLCVKCLLSGMTAISASGCVVTVTGHRRACRNLEANDSCGMCCGSCWFAFSRIWWGSFSHRNAKVVGLLEWQGDAAVTTVKSRWGSSP